MIEKEWDNIAEVRDQIIQSRKDISLLDVTEPFIMESIGTLYSSKSVHVLDCGCGTGHLSHLICKKLNKKVTAIDISGKSINLAKKNYEYSNNNLNFIKASICDYEKHNKQHDICVANMVLMDVLDLEKEFKFNKQYNYFWRIFLLYYNTSLVLARILELQ